MKKIPAVLSVAGSDPSGGAGIQGDLKTFSAFGVYGMAVISAFTAQNTRGVFRTKIMDAGFFQDQLEAVLSDIRPASVKTGMLGSAKTVLVMAKEFCEYRVKNLVIDPVMISKSGKRLCSAETVKAAAEKLFPLAALLTPNIPEAENLTGMKIRNEKEMRKAALLLKARGSFSVLLKGGHLPGGVCPDFFSGHGAEFFLRRKRIRTKNTHGTGCAFSAAAAACLARGMKMGEAVRQAAVYTFGAIENSFSLGRGWGPLNHFWRKNAVRF